MLFITQIIQLKKMFFCFVKIFFVKRKVKKTILIFILNSFEFQFTNQLETKQIKQK